MKFLALAALALSGSIAIPANAEIFGVMFVVPVGVHSGYTAFFQDQIGQTVATLDMNMRWEPLPFIGVVYTIFEVRDEAVDLFKQQVVEICWEGGQEGAVREGCRPTEWEMGVRWHSIYPLSEGQDKFN